MEKCQSVGKGTAKIGCLLIASVKKSVGLTDRAILTRPLIEAGWKTIRFPALDLSNRLYRFEKIAARLHFPSLT